MIRDVAIDLGTTTVSVLTRGEGVVLAEPSVLARVVETGEVVAVGAEAWQMMGRTPEGLEAVRPLCGGTITDFESAEAMIRAFLRRAGVRRMVRPRVVVCVPSSVTAVEQRAVREAARVAGASEVELLGHSMAAAMGIGLPVDQPQGSMVVDIGGGSTEAAVVSLGGLVALESRRLGGLDLDLQIRDAVGRRHGVTIGVAEAERLKRELGSAGGDYRSLDDRNAAAFRAVRGRSPVSGAVEEVNVTAVEIADAIHDGVMTMIDAVVDCLGWTPPEIADDLLGNGIHLAGGGALLDGMAEAVSRHAKVPVTVVDDPGGVVVLGAGRCLGLFTELEGIFLGDLPGLRSSP